MPHRKGATKKIPLYERIEILIKDWYPIFIIIGAALLMLYFGG